MRDVRSVSAAEFIHYATKFRCDVSRSLTCPPTSPSAPLQFATIRTTSMIRSGGTVLGVLAIISNA